MGQRAGSKVGAVLDTKNKVKDKANAVKENIKDMPTQTAYAVHSAKEKAKSSVSDFKRGMVQEQQSRQSGRMEKREQHRRNIADKRMELQKAQEARQTQRKADGSATTGATRPHERPATASTIPKPTVEKTQEVKRPATATTSKASEPVKTNVVKERPLSSGASDKDSRGNTSSSMGQRAGSKVGAVLDTKNKVKDKANAVKENIKDMPTQTAYAVHSAKEKAKSSVSDFKRGMVQEQQSRQSGRMEKREQHRRNIADKRMELQKAQEARQTQRKADGSATTGATRPHERPATASTIPKPTVEKTQEVKRPATATTSKASEPVKTNVVKERPLSSGASDRKTTQPTQPVHRQNVEKVVSQETRQNYTKDRRTKVQQTQNVQKNQQNTEKPRNLVTKKGQKKK